MHLDPEDLIRPDDTPPGLGRGRDTADTPTQAWPRPRRSRNTPMDTPTRLALDALAHVAEPTAVVPTVPPPRAVRTDPPPLVSQIPAAARSRAAHPSAGRPVPDADASPANLVAHILDQQHELNLLAANRIRRIGPGGLFGWRPLGGPTVAEVAAARQKIAEQQEQRRVRHQRHMDGLEIVRAYLGVLALVLLVVLIGAMAAVALGIFLGYFTWGPTHGGAV